MSVSGILSSGFSSNQLSSQYRLTNSQFQQLGQDLATGNLSGAQSDFAALQQGFTQSASTSASPTSNPVAQAFNQLATDLKSGNMAEAKQDYSTLQQDLQNLSAGLRHRPHHHHASQGTSATSLFATSTDATSAASAQQSYATLQQLLTGGDTNANGTAAAGRQRPEPPIQRQRVSFVG